MQNQLASKHLRSFGLTVGGIFAVIGVWPFMVRGEHFRWWALVLTGLLVIPATVLPRSLAPVYRMWMAAGYALGWINSRIILGLIFYGMFTPIRVIRSLFAKDPMRRKFEPDAESYRIERTPRPASHMKQQF